MLFASDVAGATALIVAISGLVGALAGGVAAIIKLWRRDDVTDKRVDLLWEASLRRGRAESTLNQFRVAKPGSAPMVTADSPTAELVIRDDVRLAYEPIAPYLRQLRSQSPGMTKVQFAETIERSLGEWIVRHICLPLAVSEFACHDMAWEVSEEKP